MRARKSLVFLALCAWLTAQADAPTQAAPASPVASPAAEALDARKLGVNEALLNYCGTLDPAGAEKLRAKIRKQVEGVSQEQLAAVRGSEEYRKGREAMADFVSKIEQRNAKRVCSRD